MFISQYNKIPNDTHTQHTTTLPHPPYIYIIYTKSYTKMLLIMYTRVKLNPIWV